MHVVLAFVVRFVIIPHILVLVEVHIRHNMSACNCFCVLVCLGGLPTYRDVSPELGHVVVVGAQELGEPADGPLAAFVHSFISFKVLIVFVD